jgi:CheY-like chemotaxis protein
MTPNLNRRILLVDDDPAGAELTLAALAVLDPALQVDVVGDGEEALDYVFRRGSFGSLPREQVGSLLLDLKMPKVDGHEVLRLIRAEPSLRGLRVVVLTSSDQDRDRELSRALGTDGYVVKPASIASLIGELRRCAHLLLPTDPSASL